MNKKILILGASGLLGQALVDFFKQKDYIIGALSRKSLSYDDKSINTYNIDILDYVLLDKIIKVYDVIINCTGQITNPIAECFLLNTKGITNIIDATKKYNKKLINISSVSVYGSAKYVDENTTLNPETPYATMKSFADYLIKKELDNYVILRVSNLFGENQKKGIINYLTKSYLANNKELHFNNNGNLKRYYLHVEDFTLLMHKIINKNIVGIYNIIGNDNLTIKELVIKFEDILNVKFNIKYQDTAPIENIDIINCSNLNNKISLNYKIDMNSYIKGLIK